jgi:hypothetical protein
MQISPSIKAAVIDNPTLERDMSSKAIINKNNTEYEKRIAFKNLTAKRKKELEDLKGEVANLKELVQSLIASR